MIGQCIWYQITENCPYRKALTAFPSSSNRIGCDYFPSNNPNCRPCHDVGTWHEPSLSQPFDLLSHCPEWGLRSSAFDFIEPDLDCFWPFSTLHAQLKCLGKISKDPMCGPCTHQTTPLLLQPHMPAELTTRASLPKLSALQPATDMRVIWETWCACREPPPCNSHA